MLRGVRRALNGRRNHNKSDTKEEEVREDDNDELVVGEEEEDYNGTSNQDHEHNTAKKMKQQQKNPYKTLTQAAAGTTTSRTLLSPLNSTEAEMIGYIPTSSTSELDDSFSYIREEEELAFHNNNHNSSYTLHNKEPQHNEQESSSCLVGAAAVAFPLPQQQQREASTETTTMEPQQEQRQESIPISPTTSHTQKTTITATTTTTCTTTTLQHEESSPSPSSSSACPEQQEQEQPPPPPRITTTTTSSSCSPVVEEETCIPEHMAVDDTNSLQFSYPSQQMSLLSTSPIHSNMHTYYSKNNNNNFSQPECHTHNNLPRGAGGCSSSTPAVPKASFLRTPSPKREGPSGKYPPRPQLYSTIPATVTGSTSLSPSGPPLSSPPGMTTVSTHTAQYLSPSKPSPPPPSGMGGIVDRAGAGMRGYSICSYSSDDDDGVTMDPSILSTASSLTADDCFFTTTTPTPAPPSGTTISATMRSSPTSDASGRTQWLVEDVPQWQGHGSLLGLAPKQSASRSTAKDDDDDDIDIALDECQDAKKMELIRADFIAYNSAYSPNMNDHDEVFEEDDNNAGDEDMEDLLSWNGGSRPSRVLSSSSVFRPGNNMNNSKTTTPPPTKTMPISAASVTATTMPSPHNHTTNTTPTNENVCTPPALSNQSCLSLSQVRRLKSKARLENLAKADVPCSSSSGGGGGGDHNDKSPPEALTPPRTTVLTMTSGGDASLPSLTSRGDASLPSLTSRGDASLPSLTSGGDASLPSSPLPRTVEFPKEEQEEKQDPQSPTRREQIELLPPCSPASASSSTSSPSLMLNHNKSNTQHTLLKPTTTTSPAIRAATTPEETAIASQVRKEMESESMGEGFRSASPKVERSRAVYRTDPVLFSRLPPRETKESPPEKEELEEDGDVHVKEEENPLEKAPSQQQPHEPPTPKHRNSTIRTMEHDDSKKNTTQDKDEPDTSNQNENSNTTNQAVAMGGKKRKSIRRGFSSIFRSLRRNPTLTSAAMDKNNNNESPRNTTSPTRKSLRHRRKRSQMTADAPIANTLSSSPAEQETCPRPQRPIHPPQQQRQNQQQRQQEVTEEEELTKATEGGESSKRRKRGSHNQGEVERAAVEPKEGQLWQLNRSLSRESASTAGLSQSSSYTFRFVGVLDAKTSKDKSSSEVTSTASLESPRRKTLYAESAQSSTPSADALVVQNHKTKTQPETPKTERRSNYSGRARYSTPAIEQARLRKEAASSRAAQVKSRTKARSDSFYQTQNKNVGASVTWFVCLENNTAPLHVAQDADLHQVSLQEKPQEQQQDGKATVPFMLLPVRSDSPKRTHKSNSPTRPFMPHVQSTQSFHSPRKRTTVECADGSHLRSKLFDPGRLKRLVGGGNDSSSSTDLVVSTQAQESSSSLRTLALLDHQHQLGSSTAMVVRREEDRAIVPFEEVT